MDVTVSKIHIYPFKSAKGQFVRSARLTARGLENDRIWMAVDENGVFLSQRNPGCAKMATLIADIVANDDLLLQANGMNMLRVSNPDNHVRHSRVPVTVHSSQTIGLDAGDEAASWMSDFLGQKSRIVKFPSDGVRRADPRYYGEQGQTAYADGGPVLITSTSTLGALGLGPEYSANFRGNIELSGLEPFQEDVLGLIQVGNDALLYVNKPCVRCPVPGINQKDGSKDGTALKVLRKFRYVAEDGDFKGNIYGQNAVPMEQGTIEVGMKVRVLLFKNPHPVLRNLPMRYGIAA